MRIGIIDLGTNSVRFDIHQILPNGGSRRLYRERLMVKLGHGVFQTGTLAKKTSACTLDAFKLFRGIGDQFCVEQYVAVGTSALRDARDGRAFVNKVKASTGIDLRVISGAEEARLIADGFLRNEAKNLKSRFLLIDIGGGSTEFTIGAKGQRKGSVSLNVGAARMKQLFLGESLPPSSEAITRLREHVELTIRRNSMLRDVSNTVCFGSSGSIRALCKLARKKNSSISRKRLDQLVNQLSSSSRTQLLTMPRMEEDRVDLILAGALILQTIMHALNIDDISVSDTSLRDGLLNQAAHRAVIRQSSHFQAVSVERQQLDRRLTVLFGSRRDHDSRRDFAHRLFEGLQPIHHLSARAKEIFLIATSMLSLGHLLRDQGRGGPLASLALCSDVIHLSEGDRLVIGQLMLNQFSTKVEKEDLPFSRDRATLDMFQALFVLQRTFLALTSCFSAAPRIASVQISRQRVRVRILARATSGLSQLRLDAVQEAFKSTFKHGIDLTIAKG